MIVSHLTRTNIWFQNFQVLIHLTFWVSKFGYFRGLRKIETCFLNGKKKLFAWYSFLLHLFSRGKYLIVRQSSIHHLFFYCVLTLSRKLVGPICRILKLHSMLTLRNTYFPAPPKASREQGSLSGFYIIRLMRSEGYIIPFVIFCDGH